MAKAKTTTEKDPMAKVEKFNDGTMSGLKKTIIGTIGTVVAAGGTFLISFLNSPKKDDKAVPAQPAININIPAQQQAASGKTVIIKEKAPADKDIKKAENSEKPKAKKKDGDEFKEDAPKW